MTSSRVSKAGRLRRVAESQALVRIKRSPRNADRVDGIVVSVGSKWALIAHTGDGGFFEGLVAIHVEDVVKVEKGSSFEERFAQTWLEWPPTVPADLDLDTTADTVRSAAKRGSRHGYVRWLATSGSWASGVASLPVPAAQVR